MNALLQIGELDVAARVVAVGDQKQRLLAMLSRPEQRQRLGDGVVERGRAVGLNRAELIADPLPIRRPAFEQVRRVVEAVAEHFVFGPQQIEQEAIERRTRG